MTARPIIVEADEATLARIATGHDPATSITVVAPTEAERKARWLAARKLALTGTDAGRILTGKGFDVWLEKTGQSEPIVEDELPDFMHAGRYYESGTLKWYADREGVGIEFADSYQFIRHPNPALPIGCTLDARRLDDRRPVDAKMIHRWSPFDPESGTGWGEPDSPHIPTIYAAQMAVQMAVLDAERGDFPVFFRVDGEFSIFRCQRNHDQEARLLAFLAEWHDRHIVKGERPAASDTDAATAFLARIPRVSETVRKATPEEESLALQLMVARDGFDEMESEKKRLTNALREAVGADLGIQGKSWKFTHKANKDGERIDHEAVARHLLQHITRTDGPVVAAEVHGKAIDASTQITRGARVARFTTTKKEG